MYTRFFGLREKPFSITPDPRYLYQSERHQEALAHLAYGVKESGGFIQLTGEVGTGKTTVTRALLNRLPEQVDVAMILNPRLNVNEFLLTICEELQIPLPANTQSNKALVDALNRHLLEAHAEGQRIVVIVDEAQNLDSEVLEQVRLLTNLETGSHKLLQIILIGQPELRQILARNDLRQLAQRITARYHLEPLSIQEAGGYIRHRLEVAGATSDIFTKGAIREVHRLSTGIPRLINVICDRALLGAYTGQVHTITPSIVHRAAAEIQDVKVSSRWRPWITAAAMLLLSVGIASAAWFAATRGAGPEAVATAQPVETTQVENTADLAMTQPSTVETQTEPEPEPIGVNVDPNEGLIPLSNVLATHSDQTGTDSAFRELFSLWTLSLDGGGARPCEQAFVFGLRCLFQRGSVEHLKALNHPAILTLTDQYGTDHQAVLEQIIDNNLATIRIGDHSANVSMDEVNRHWRGEYLVLWKPVHGTDDLLRPGMRGSSVVWLRNGLGRVLNNPAEASPSNVFDETLSEQVRTFQKESGLLVDGIAGVRTLIALNAALEIPDTPYLQDRNVIYP
ncbi:MAG: AAA family ATPase [Pseudomonadota bacterium]